MQPWIPRDERRLSFAPQKQGVPRMVTDYIDSTSAIWKQEKLEEFFVPMDVEMIKGIPLSTRNQVDFWAWHFERTRIFSVRSAHRTLVTTKKNREDWLDGRAASLSAADEGKLWSKLWKCKVPSKIRIFLWILALCSRPTGDIRHHRNMATSSARYVARRTHGGTPGLIECTMSRYVWALADPVVVEHIRMTTDPSARQWLFSMMQSVAHEEFTRMVVTMWAIWHARRKVIHEEIFQSPMATNQFVESKAGEGRLECASGSSIATLDSVADGYVQNER